MTLRASIHERDTVASSATFAYVPNSLHYVVRVEAFICSRSLTFAKQELSVGVIHWSEHP